jgi:hypothetical protein
MEYELYADNNHWVVWIKHSFGGESFVKFPSHSDAMDFLFRLVKEA